MDSDTKLTRSQRQQIIFDYLKTGKSNPLYDVIETKHGKYIVKPKSIQLEEEETINEPPSKGREDDSSEEPSDTPPPPPKRDNRKRTKQDAKRILEALTSIINESSGDESDDEYQRAPPIIEPRDFNPQPKLSFHRRILSF